jgi:hypothetical protein
MKTVSLESSSSNIQETEAPGAETITADNISPDIHPACSIQQSFFKFQPDYGNV